MSDLPDTLYHYTSQQGVIGILADNSIWATKIHYLNDSKEYELALHLGSDSLRSRLKATRSTKLKRKINCLLTNLKSIELLNVCVTSFSEERDLLSQWRAYASTGGGLSLGLKVANLIEQANRQDFALVQCEYEEDRQASIVDALLDDCLSKEFNTVGGRVDPKRPNTFVVFKTGGDFSERFARLAPLLKSRAFREEREWRLVSKRGINVQNMSFRPGTSMLVPYVPFTLGPDIPTYLESLTVGPTPHTRLAQSAASSLLAKTGAARTVKVYGSDAPFRAW